MFLNKKNIYLICRSLNKIKTSFALVLISFITPSLHTPDLWAWGAKGHYVICEAAIHLIKNPELKAYLIHKTHNMGHLCNIPDIYWRQLPDSESGNATHYIEPDLVGENLEDSPTTITEFVAKYRGKTSITKKNKVFSVEKEIGTLWWRADQFIRLAITSGKAAKALPPPEKKDEKNDDYPYNKSIFNMITNMGLLGHFVGDASQPLHNTYNYDGWENGHGGVHGYYEEMIVVNLKPQLLDQVIKQAPIVERELDLSVKSSASAKMKKLSLLAHKDLDQLWKLDPIEKKSSNSNKKGMSLRKSAQRSEASKVTEKFAPLIIKQMSRSAVLLAHFWDEIYTQSQTPNLEPYKGYKFPLEPDFVEPDYIKTN